MEIISNITWQESSLIGQVYGKDLRYLTSSLFLIHIESRKLGFPKYIMLRSAKSTHDWKLYFSGGKFVLPMTRISLLSRARTDHHRWQFGSVRNSIFYASLEANTDIWCEWCNWYQCIPFNHWCHHQCQGKRWRSVWIHFYAVKRSNQSIQRFYTSSGIHNAYLQRSLLSSLAIFQPPCIDSSQKTNTFNFFYLSCWYHISR